MFNLFNFDEIVAKEAQKTTEPSNNAEIASESIEKVEVANNTNTESKSVVGSEFEEKTPLVEGAEQNETLAEAVVEENEVTEPVVVDEKPPAAESTPAQQDPSDDDIFGALSLKASEEDKKSLEDEKKSGIKAIGTKTNTKPNATSSTKAEDDFSNVNVETVIRIGREQLSILDFFTLDEINLGIPKKVKADEEQTYRAITGEDVRARLEKQGFVEFVKDYTKMIYLGTKGRNFILPMTVAKVKGAPMDKEPVLAENSASTPSILESVSKRIPSFLYDHFLSVAHFYSRLNIEVRAEFYYNYDADEFYLYYPQQMALEYTVDKIESDDVFTLNILEERGQYCELVCEIHSHHRFAAIPSDTDNYAERRPRMTYAIVGHVEAHNKADFFARKFNLKEDSRYGTYTRLSHENIFDENTYELSDEELAKYVFYVPNNIEYVCDEVLLALKNEKHAIYL